MMIARYFVTSAPMLEARQTSSTSQTGSHRSTGSSISALVSTLVPALILAVILITAFILLRRRLRHVYRPRSYVDILGKTERTEVEHDTFFSWIKDLATTGDDHVLTHQSLDAYLYVRFLKMTVVLCFVGTCLTWPILFPVNATGGGGETGLDILSFSNINSAGRYFAPTFVAWVYLAFVIYVITRETLHYINLRQAYLLSSWNASRISSRTVLFTSVPDDELDAQHLIHLFPACKQIWIAVDPHELEDKVEEAEETAMRLEEAEIELCKAANDKHGQKEEDKETSNKQEGVTSRPENASNKAIDVDCRPTHRLKKVKFFGVGEEVDTIEWARDGLAEALPEIKQLQSSLLNGDGKRFPAVLVEFEDQQAAMIAFALSNHNEPGHIVGRQIGILPDEVIWKNLGITYWQYTLRYLGATSIVCAMILLWSPLTAFVGILSNVNYLAENVPFLAWLNDMPQFIMGVITGLLPTLLLALLMVLVPIILRKISEAAGAVTRTEVEMQTQTWYFVFQLIQVFLITTFTSGATSVAAQIFQQPSSAVLLLAKNLPKASNFYISYFVLQGLAMSSRYLVQPLPLVKDVLKHFKAKTPRQQFERYTQLPSLKLGSKLPKFTNLAVIAISYSTIAPLMLGFATVGLLLVYFAERYNTLYVYDCKAIDTKGAAYARAMQHLTVGVYLSEFCLIGLFAIRSGDSAVSVAPLVLMIVFLVATGVWHFVMRTALKPLMQNLPRNLLLQATGKYDDVESASASVQEASKPDREPEKNNSAIHVANNSSFNSAPSRRTNDMTRAQNENVNGNDSHGSKRGVEAGKTTLYTSSSSPDSRRSRMFSFFQPKKDSAAEISARLPPHFHEPVEPYSEEVARNAFLHPSVKWKPPKLWIVKDGEGCSEKEIRATRDKVPSLEISDDGARFDDKGKVVVDVDWRESPMWEKSDRFKY